MSILPPKISDDLLFWKKNLDFTTNNSSLTPFLSQLVDCLTSNNSSSQNIGGTNAWAVPTSNLGDRPPVPHKSPPMIYHRYIYSPRAACRHSIHDFRPTSSTRVLISNYKYS